MHTHELINNLSKEQLNNCCLFHDLYSNVVPNVFTCRSLFVKDWAPMYWILRDGVLLVYRSK